MSDAQDEVDAILVLRGEPVVYQLEEVAEFDGEFLRMEKLLGDKLGLDDLSDIGVVELEIEGKVREGGVLIKVFSEENELN